MKHVKLGELRDRASDLVGEIARKYFEEELPENMRRLVDTPGFWDWIAGEAVPTIRPYIISWLKRDGHAIIGKRFNVAGRVSDAINRMDAREVHQAIDEVAAEQLGAIQVLGYIIGLMAGILLVL